MSAYYNCDFAVRVSVKLHLRHNGGSKRQTDRRQESNLMYFALKCDIRWHWQYFNDFPDNQLTKLSVFIGWSRIFIQPLKFLWNIALRPHWRWTPLTRHNGQTNKQTDFRRHLCRRWSLTLIRQLVWLFIFKTHFALTWIIRYSPVHKKMQRSIRQKIKQQQWHRSRFTYSRKWSVDECLLRAETNSRCRALELDDM